MVDDTHADDTIRDVLRRFLIDLDKRRPWLTPPYQEKPMEGIVDIINGDPIASIPVTQMEFRNKTRLLLHNQPGGRECAEIVITLRNGENVLLRASSDFGKPGIDVIAWTDPASTISHLSELIGLPVVPK